uniref:Uncharacterized protein n=1 Tax=Lepeophtheirus salmonis TaxID=72036 RepID=A0A0K2UPZ7_LEPSM
MRISFPLGSSLSPRSDSDFIRDKLTTSSK